MTDNPRVRLTNDWLPLPDALLTALGWRDGDEIELEVSGDCLIVSRTGEAFKRSPILSVKKAKAL